jgi:signal transduction histidine kinase
LFRDSVERNLEVRLTVMLESLVAVSEAGDDGAIRLTRPLGESRFDEPYSGWYWQVNDGSEPALRSRSLWDQTLADTTTRYQGSHETAGPERQVLRVVARTITLPGADRPLVFRVAADRGEIEREIAAFNSTLAWSLGALGIGLLAAIFLQVRFGLRPLGDIGRALSDIRSGRRGRLEGDFPAEIEPLAAELNALLEHDAAMIGRARRHVGNLAHALKTPLSVLTNDATAAEGPLAEAVERQTELIRRQIDHHLVRARAAGTAGLLGARSDVGPVIESLRRALSRIHQDRDVSIEVACPRPVTFRGERQDLEEMLGNLVDNACKWARSRVRITAAAEGERLRLVVEDDGPGLSETDREAVMERGRRLDESVPGSGLGLAIVHDIADLYGGGLTLSAATPNGLHAELDLPAADPTATS